MQTLLLLLLLHTALCEEHVNKPVSGENNDKVLVKRQYNGYGGMGYAGMDHAGMDHPGMGYEGGGGMGYAGGNMANGGMAYGGDTGFGGDAGVPCTTPPCNHGGIPQMGYYTQECNEAKECPDKTKQFCQLGKCLDRLEENVACTKKGQCTDATHLCQFGKCKAGTAADFKPGAFCSKHKECKDKEQCCRLMPSINPHHKICVPKLKTGMTCGGLGMGCGGLHGALMGTDSIHSHHDEADSGAQEGCAPCELALVCKEIGLVSSYMICKDP